MLYRLLRPILFRLDPESAHAVSLQLLRWTGRLAPLRALVRAGLSPRGTTPVRAFGLNFPNCLGLAAGYDKDGLAWRGLGCLGFGHAEIGTVTPRPQPGNPPPRLFRLTRERSLINRLGFPSRGADFVALQLRGARGQGPIIGVNLGKQKETPLERATEDYELLIDRFAPLADYLVVNVSSPNTPELRRLQEKERLGPLLERLARRRSARAEGLGRAVPLLVKLSPDLGPRELDQALEVIVETGLDGIIATNTTIGRPALDSTAAAETGGLSGAALFESSTACLRRIRERVGDKLPLIACGGVMGPEDARAKLQAGASLVQLYTGLIYEGPTLVRRILRAI